ncbi:hypothetical protein BX666DRAFT_1935011 [Dichotomocladium elegans]|nr:hypothetical protein BX666DRAFT_1935011 [Dichotomocladium elegans]
MIFSIGLLYILFIFNHIRLAGAAFAINATLPYRSAVASAQRDNSITVFGGLGNTGRCLNEMFALTQTETGYDFSTISRLRNAPFTVYSKAVYDKQNDALIVIGGTLPALEQVMAPLNVFWYDFTTDNWTNLTSLSDAIAIWPENRIYFDLVHDTTTRSIYLSGGSLNRTIAFKDMWKIQIHGRANVTFEQLPGFPSPRYSHTMTLLQYVCSVISPPPKKIESANSYKHIYHHTAVFLPPPKKQRTGQIVSIGGIDMSAGPYSDTLRSLQTVDIFDTRTNAWSQVAAVYTSEIIPENRANHNAVLDPERGRIVVFGGDNGPYSNQPEFLNSIGYLDYRNWTWSRPKFSGPRLSGRPPSRRSYATAHILDGKHLTVAFGMSLNMWYNDVNVYSLEDDKWITAFETQAAPTSTETVVTMSKLRMVGIIVGAFGISLIIVAVFVVIKYPRMARKIMQALADLVYVPRHGEPRWTEILRLVCLASLLLIFLSLMAFILHQVLVSPIVVQRYRTPDHEARVPDVRFCFDGFRSHYNNLTTDSLKPQVACETDGARSCNAHIYMLNTSVFAPVFRSVTTHVRCFLFRPPEDFGLCKDGSQYSRSRLVFTLFGDPSQALESRIYVSIYPRQKDPNAFIYGFENNATAANRTLLTEDEISRWKINEQYKIRPENTFSFSPLSFGTLSYTLSTYESLEDTGWNYVGIFQRLKRDPVVHSSFSQDPSDPSYLTTHRDLGYINLIPADYAVIRDTEIKVYTLLNALGFVGGVFSIIFSFDVFLFGARPRSPWGVVQRWSFGPFRRSILTALKTKFNVSSAMNEIPFTDSVYAHRRRSLPTSMPPQDLLAPASDEQQQQQQQQQRVERIEERVRILEEIMTAYHLDNEVFVNLSAAVARQQKKQSTASLDAGVSEKSIFSRKRRRKHQPPPSIEETSISSSTVGANSIEDCSNSSTLDFKQ